MTLYFIFGRILCKNHLLRIVQCNYFMKLNIQYNLRRIAVYLGQYFSMNSVKVIYYLLSTYYSNIVSV